MGKQLIKKTQGCSWLENKIIEKQLKPSTSPFKMVIYHLLWPCRVIFGKQFSEENSWNQSPLKTKISIFKKSMNQKKIQNQNRVICEHFSPQINCHLHLPYNPT